MAEMTTAGGVAYVRTPEDRFVGIGDYPHEPRYADIDGLRMAYVKAEPDEAGDDTATILLLHGEPTWGYLHRKMIPPLVEGGCRVVVPDLIGFGRSDKPVERSAHTFAGHVEWMRQFMASTAAGRIPGAAGQPHAQFRPAGHFIQEDQGLALAEAIVAWLS